MITLVKGRPLTVRTGRISGCFVLCFLIFGLPCKVAGQWWDLGAGTGVSAYAGDIKMPLFSVRPGAGGMVYGKYNFSPHWGLRIQLAQRRVLAADSLAGDSVQIRRNLSFRSDILEAGLDLEFNFWPYVPGSRTKKASPYLGVGVRRFFFDPMARYKGALVALQPLGTEGQGLGGKPGLGLLGLDEERYALNAWSFPVTFGFRYNLRQNHGFGIEWTYCYTTTDYLDDIKGKYFDASWLRLYRSSTAADLSDRSVELGLPSRDPLSQRGVNAYNDAYWSLMAYYTYSIPSRRCRIKS